MKMKFAIMVVLLAGMSFFSYAQRILTIEQALDIAEDNNPSMKTSKLNYERTQYQLEASRAALKPQFSMNVSPFSYSQSRNFDTRYSEWYTSKTTSSGGTFRTELPFLLTDGTLALVNRFNWQNSESTRENVMANKSFSNNLSIQYNQPLFMHNTQRMAMERLEFNHENSGINYALQRLRTEQSITRQFYQVYSAKNQLEISLTELENSRKNYEIVKNQVEASLSPRSELNQAEVNLANAESSLLRNTVSLANAKDNLKQTLGMLLDEDIDVLVSIDATPILIDEKKAIHSGLTSRMELRQREISLEFAEFTLIETRNGRQNSFNGNLALSLGITGDNPRFENIYSTPTQSPSIGLSLTVPIFDWGQRKARIKADETALTIAQLDYENLRVDIELAIRQSIRELENLRRQIEIQQISMRNAEQTYALYEVRYREGDITGLQMGQYQTQLSSARTSYVNAQISYKNELLSLKILTLYDFEKDQPIIPIKELSNITIR